MENNLKNKSIASSIENQKFEKTKSQKGKGDFKC